MGKRKKFKCKNEAQKRAIKASYARKAQSSKRQEAEYPHFRYYRKSGHPALITSEYSSDEFNFRKVSHSEKDGRHLNEKVEPNPNKSDPNPMYIAKRVRHDRKAYFGAKLDWKYPK